MRDIRPTLPASKARARRRRRFYIRAALLLLLLVLLTGGLAGLTYLPQISIASVKIDGAMTISARDIEEHVRAKIAGRYAFLFPKKNIFLYPQEGIEKSLLSSFPTMKTVDVGFKNFRTIHVTVTERGPHALWCGVSRTVSVPCHLLDKEGVVYARAPEFSGAVYLTYFGELSSSSPIGAALLEKDAFQSLAALVAELAHEHKALSVEITGKDASVLFDDDFTLLLSLDNTPENILSRLSAIRGAPPLQGKPFSVLSYIDLRFGNKVYFKLK